MKIQDLLLYFMESTHSLVQESNHQNHPQRNKSLHCVLGSRACRSQEESELRVFSCLDLRNFQAGAWECSLVDLWRRSSALCAVFWWKKISTHTLALPVFVARVTQLLLFFTLLFNMLKLCTGTGFWVRRSDPVWKFPSFHWYGTILLHQSFISHIRT